MHRFIGELLELENNSKKKILDAGCGVGATSIYLAKQFSNVDFTGITLAPSEVKLAKNLQKKMQADNVDFYMADISDNCFPGEQYDGIFALESFNYALDKLSFVKEFHRLLKPGGKIVVLDGFLTKKKVPIPLNGLYKYFLKQRGIADQISYKEYESYLKSAGFHNIIIRDLTHNNIIKNFLQVQYYIGALKSKERINFLVCSFIPEIIVGLFDIARYYAIVAEKNE